MKKMQISRRTLLRGLGASLALPPLEMMAGDPLGKNAPKRLCCIFQPNGVFPKAWDVKALGAEHQLSPILAPLK